MADSNHTAKLVLTKARALNEPLSIRKDARVAAASLVEEFLKLAAETSLETQTLDGRGGIIAIGPGGGRVTVLSNSDGVSVGWAGPYAEPTSYTKADLTFDPLAKVFESNKVDTDIAPTPGERLPRVEPLVVLAQLVADLVEAAGTES